MESVYWEVDEDGAVDGMEEWREAGWEEHSMEYVFGTGIGGCV